MPDVELVIAGHADAHLAADDRLELPFASRSRSRHRAVLGSGATVSVLLPRGTILRGGDKVRVSDGRIVLITAADEDLLEVRCTGRALARAAYHLGNRHVAVEVGDGWLRLARDHVLEDLLRGLGVAVVHVRRPFEPEAGAYAAGHAHPAAPTARIHAFGNPP